VNKLIDHASRAITADRERFEVTKVSILQETLRGEVGRKFPAADVRIADNNIGDAELLGETAQIIGAVSEMIDNAVKYGPTDTPVQVQTSVEDSRVEISVQDEGTELATTAANELFKPYERGAMMGNNLARGAGLGLHFAKAVAEIHGGGVRFEHDADNHSIFTLWLPLTNQR
jgi:K+-sensing histidine kinase KdpD